MSTLLPKISSATPLPLSSSSNSDNLPHPPTSAATKTSKGGRGPMSPNRPGRGSELSGFEPGKLRGLAGTPVDVIIDVIGPEIVGLNGSFKMVFKEAKPPLTTGLARSKASSGGQAEPKISLTNVSRSLLNLNYPASLVKLSNLKSVYDLIKSVNGNMEMRAAGSACVSFSEYLRIYYVLIAGRGIDRGQFDTRDDEVAGGDGGVRESSGEGVEEGDNEENVGFEIDSRTPVQIQAFNEQRKSRIDRLQEDINKRASFKKRQQEEGSGASITWEVTISSPPSPNEAPTTTTPETPVTSTAPTAQQPPATPVENPIYAFVHRIDTTPNEELKSDAKSKYSELNLYDNVDMPICYSDVELGLKALGCSAYKESLDGWVWDWRAREIGDKKLLKKSDPQSEDEYSDDEDHSDDDEDVVIVTPNDFTSNVLDFNTFWKLLNDLYDEARETVKVEERKLIGNLCTSVLESAIDESSVRGEMVNPVIRAVLDDTFGLHETKERARREELERLERIKAEKEEQERRKLEEEDRKVVEEIVHLMRFEVEDMVEGTLSVSSGVLSDFALSSQSIGAIDDTAADAADGDLSVSVSTGVMSSLDETCWSGGTPSVSSAELSSLELSEGSVGFVVGVHNNIAALNE
ncbi:hypothetical protein TrVE_jg6861 [Triparma verrucosa]|uniref:Uncharacterized protein n=1 Tax=Triparma verrucosa TaxID=1606542 RepID=A0A9W7BLQ7_9STRA|nr:hypothetical protein TrVE_jg6861 [Triparma verrucosa]